MIVFFIKCDQDLLESSGEMIFIDDIGTCSQITICHPDIIPKENVLEQNVTLKGISSDSVVLPMARVALKYSGALHSDDNPCSKNRCKAISWLCEIKKPIGMH